MFFIYSLKLTRLQIFVLLKFNIKRKVKKYLSYSSYFELKTFFKQKQEKTYYLEVLIGFINGGFPLLRSCFFKDDIF